MDASSQVPVAGALVTVQGGGSVKRDKTSPEGQFHIGPHHSVDFYPVLKEVFYPTKCVYAVTGGGTLSIVCHGYQGYTTNIMMTDLLKVGDIGLTNLSTRSHLTRRLQATAR